MSTSTCVNTVAHLAVVVVIVQVILQALLDHVSHRTLGICHQNAQRQLGHGRERKLYAPEHVADLRAVSVGDNQAHSFVQQRTQVAQATAGIGEFVVNRIATAAGNGVSAQGDDNASRAHLTSHSEKGRI